VKMVPKPAKTMERTLERSNGDVTEIFEEALGRGRVAHDGTPSAPASPASRGLLEELFEELARGTDPVGQPVLHKAVAFGQEWFLADSSASDLLREVNRLGRGLEESLAERGLIDDAQRQRLRLLAELAAVRALDAHDEGRKGRRDRWLSFFAHEMRNSLNTLVNAAWILRNSENPSQTQRICDMADRAIKRLEEKIKDMRELEAAVAKPAPGKPDPGVS
jgi:signal transduction histidine kinase